MSLTTNFLDELRSRITLSAVIARSIALRRGGREFKACCPFHQEKTSSFTVSDDKGFYHCFGCGAHGDVIRWMTDYCGESFIDAVRALCGEAGMEMPERSPGSAARVQRIEGIRPTLEAAQALYARELEMNGQAREYLFRRGIDDGLMARFDLGWAPARSGHLREIGIELPQALAAGLAWQNADRAGTVFHLRVMVPVHDRRGRLIGFGGRSLNHSDLIPKYKNSPDTELFDKGRVLFNAHRAAEVLQVQRRLRMAGEYAPEEVLPLIAVEGYMDVIALDGAGIQTAVAPMGTALTEAQLAQMWRLDAAPVLMFDGDAAGQRAAMRACERAMPLLTPEVSLRIVVLPDGTDPDDMVQAGRADELRDMLPEARSIDSWLFHAVIAEGGCELDQSPHRVAALWGRLEVLALSIAHEELRAQYIGLWRRWFDRLVSLNGRAAAPDVPRAIAMAPGEKTAEDAAEVLGAADDEGERRLRAILQALLAKRADIRALRQDLADMMSIAKGMGFRTKALNAVLADMEADPDAREEFEAVYLVYRRGAGVQGPRNEAMLPPVDDARDKKALSAPAARRLSRIDAYLAADTVQRQLPPPATEQGGAHGGS